jgi:hypothetical protein
VCPLGVHMSPSCTQGAPAHTQTSSFTQPITSSLCSSSIPSSNLPKEHVHSVGVMGDLTSSPTPSCCPSPLKHPSISHGISSPSLDLVTTQRLLSPQLLSSRKTPLRKLHESTKCHFSLTYCCFHTSVHLPMLPCIGSPCDFG